MNNKIAVIRLRGTVGAKNAIEDALNNLHLHRKNYCIVLENTPSLMGMVNKVRNYVTFGEIDDETYNLLVEKRGEEYKGRETDRHKKVKYGGFFVKDNKKYKLFFRLMPPKGGFERKGIKVDFKIGGALGYRKENINKLIKRMI